MTQRELVLASASPRRRELLTLLGVSFSVRPASIDESPRPGEAPGDYTLRVAGEKARTVSAVSARDSIVLAADTTVSVEEEIFGKPRDPAHARAMLTRLSGREHCVHSAVFVILPGGRTHSCLVATRVVFRELDATTIARYVDSGEPLDKAGAYGIQGLGGALVSAINGSYSAVVGLPLAETVALLDKAGVTHALARR